MKKYLAAAALVGALSLAGISMVNAHGYRGFGPGRWDGDPGRNPGFGYCDNYRYCDNRPYNEADSEKATAFFDETRDTRKQIIVKKSELRALMQQDNPDEKKAAVLAGEIFDLKNLMADKAQKTFGDTPPRNLMGPGGGFGRCGMGPRDF